MNKRAVYIVLLFALLGGCASTPALSPAERGQFEAVRLYPSVDKPDQMYYLGPGSGIGMMFGAIGGAITAAANLSPGEQFDKFAQDHDIHIERIVKEEAIKAFQTSGKLNLTDTESSNAATLRVSITMYGFSIPNGFSSELVPIVSIKCTLVDSSGKVIWSANDMTNALGNPAEGKTPDQFRADPRLIEGAWRIAARSIMANIVSHM
jgi:hypothetical protein